MARTITDEQIKLSIIINGNPAQKQLSDLEKSTRELTNTTSDLKYQQKLIEQQLGKDSNEYKQLNKEIKANNTIIDNNKASMKELQNQIGLTGLTMNQLTQKANLLKAQLRNMVPGTADHTVYKNELSAVSDRIAEVRNQSQSTRVSIGSLADGFNRYSAIGASAIAAATGLVLSLQSIVDINAKLSDSQADVMKTTGMNKAEVDELTKSFGLLQTRTGRIDLLKIAESGGRIGIAKEEISGFVGVMDKLSVSLGDSFVGGAEEVATKLGKLKFLFKETQEMGIEQSYNSIGSAINDLGANGAATETNIADFATRIGSLTDALKPTVAETLALGAAFEESGIESEVSSRAYNIFMKQASTESAKFAQVMGVSKKSVEDMINTNPMEFMLHFAEGLKGMNATDTAKILDKLGVNADGANKAIGAMANNTDRFRELIDLSNNSFVTGTSVLTEYEIKNNNLAATIEKLKKTFSGWFSSEGLVDFLTVVINLIARMVGATDKANDKTQAFKNVIVFTAKILAVLAAALLTNISYQKLVAIWTNTSTEATILNNIQLKLKAFWTAISTAGTQLLAVATALLAGNTVGATIAFRAFTAALATTPWGFIFASIAAIVVAYKVFNQQVDHSADKQKMLADIHLEASKNIAKEKVEVESLTKIAKDKTKSDEERARALKKLNEIIPDYIGFLTKENIATNEGITILKKYTAELYANAKAKAVQAKFEELAAQKLEAEGKNAGDFRKEQTFGFLSSSQYDKANSRKELEAMIKKQFKGQDTAWINDYVDKMMESTGLADKESAINAVNDKMKSLESELLKGTSKSLESDQNTESNYAVGADKPDKTSEKKNPNSSAEEIAKLEYEDKKKYLDLELDYKRKIQDDKVAIMQDGYAKERLIEDRRYEREIEELKSKRVNTSEILKLDEDIAKAKEAKDITKFNSLTKIKEAWIERNADLDKQAQQLAENKLAIHKLKIAAIDIRGNEQAIKESKEQFDREKQDRETAFNEQYLALGDNEVAKTALKKKFDIDELEAQKVFLKEKLADLKNTIDGKNGQVDYTNLSKEERQKILDAFALTKAQMSKLGLDLDELMNGKGKKDDKLTGMGTDIFGYTPGQWQDAFAKLSQLGDVNATLTDKLNNVAASIEVLGTGIGNAMAMANKFADANDQRDLKQLDKTNALKKSKLDKQLKAGIISQTQHDKAIKRLDEEKEKKQADIEYRRAVRDRNKSLFDIAINTSVGIIKAVAESPLTLGLPWSGIIAGMGILQAGLVLSQPLPARGFEAGLYPQEVRREQDGKVFNASYGGTTKSGLVNKPTYFLTGENGPEMIIDSRAYRGLSNATRNALVNELRGIKGYENGLYQQKNFQQTNTAVAQQLGTTTTDADMMRMVIQAFQMNSVAMNRLVDEGVIGRFLANDYASMKEIKDGLSNLQNIKEKSKR